MKIRSIRIQNLRSFLDETVLFNNYTCLVGANGVGKSTVLCALNIFFRETADSHIDLTCLQQEDFHVRNTEEPIVITVTFYDLSDEAKEDFSDFLIQSELVISAKATFSEASGYATVNQFGHRRGVNAFKDFFDAANSNTSVAELKTRYNSIRENFPELPPPGVKQVMLDSLRNYEHDNPENTEIVTVPYQFYGFGKGSNLLSKYVQWVFVAAVKDASSEQTEAKNSSLGKLLSRTVRAHSTFSEQVKALSDRVENEYSELVSANQDALDELSASLMRRLKEWTHPNTKLKLRWRHEEGKSIRVSEPLAEITAGEGDFEGRLARFGHGLQRCYLLALLQELSSNNETKPLYKSKRLFLSGKLSHEIRLAAVC